MLILGIKGLMLFPFATGRPRPMSDNWDGEMTKHGGHSLFGFRCHRCHDLCDKCAVKRPGLRGVLQKQKSAKRSQYFHHQCSHQRLAVLSYMFATPCRHKRPWEVDLWGHWL